jgi:hypothetical protein
MSDPPDDPTQIRPDRAAKGAQQAAERAARAARVEAALRANLLRRKQQARARAGAGTPEDDAESKEL